MNYTIAICGKGGTGKTTLAALIVRSILKKRPAEPVLAVDADPNANLGRALGVDAKESIVAIIDEVAKNPDIIDPGMTKERFLEYRIQEALVESEGFDLLSMGRPEGPGCYCYVNNLLRSLIERLSRSYSFIVIDNEAGMEHLSRRTTRKMDLLVVVSDYSRVGLLSAKRIVELSKELELEVKQAKLVVNRVPEDNGRLDREIENVGVPLAGIVPDDPEVFRSGLEAGDLRSLADGAKAVGAVEKILEEVI